MSNESYADGEFTRGDARYISQNNDWFEITMPDGTVLTSHAQLEAYSAQRKAAGQLEAYATERVVPKILIGKR